MRLSFVKSGDETTNKLSSHQSLAAINAGQVATPFGLIRYSEVVILDVNSNIIGTTRFSLTVGNVLLAQGIETAEAAMQAAQDFVDARVKEVEAVQMAEAADSKAEPEDDKAE